MLPVRRKGERLITEAEEKRSDEDDCQRANSCDEKERYDTPPKYNLLGSRTLQVSQAQMGRTIM